MDLSSHVRSYVQLTAEFNMFHASIIIRGIGSCRTLTGWEARSRNQKSNFHQLDEWMFYTESRNCTICRSKASQDHSSKKVQKKKNQKIAGVGSGGTSIEILIMYIMR